MNTPILHHYAFSTFSEKVRTALGYKGISWQSVDIPGMPPRPLLEPLTGGYRRAPVLQVGADIYCDTQLILPALDRLYPNTKPLLPSHQEGLSRGLGFAWERQMWIPTIGVLVHYIGEHIPPEFIKDRKEGYLGIDISKAAMAPQFEQHVQFLRAQYAWLKQALGNGSGKPFLFGDAPSTADLSIWQTTFLLRKNCPPDVDDLLGLKPLNAWYERIAAFGHGAFTEITPEQAFEVARAAEPAALHLQPQGDPGGLKAGSAVVVTPEDNAKVPVHGTLVAASEHEVIIHRRDAKAGNLHLHFPRLGYEVLPA